VATSGYVLYVFKEIDGSTAPIIDLNFKHYVRPVSQPLMQFTIGE